jgi:hypothetical protein
LRVWVYLNVLASAAMAQAPNASISGVVRDSVTRQPLANYAVTTDVNVTWVDNTIHQNKDTRQVKSITNDQGHYTLSDLPSGAYRIEVNNPQSFGHPLWRQITLAGHDLNGVDFNFVVEGSISGKVLDENKEPVSGMRVFLVSRQYYLGTLGYFLKGASRTNDRGEYTLGRVEAGHPYFIMAEKNARKLAAHSDVPLNPKLRRRVPMRTWYPNVLAKEGAVAVVLRPGERREGIDIQLKKSPSYCIQGTLVTPHASTALNFSIEGQQPSSGSSGDGGMYVARPFGTTSEDGEFRICDLTPGSYRLTASEEAANPNEQQPLNYIAATIPIADRDLNNLKFAAVPGIPLNGGVVWDGEPPQTPASAELSVWIQPLLRSGISGEETSAKSNIPGTFTVPDLLTDEYAVHVFLNVPGLYVRDISYGTKSVRYRPLQVVSNDELRVIIGHDGGTISVRVADKDGNPVGDMRVLLVPEEADSEAALQSMLITGTTDQLGNYTSRTLAPGKYYAAASSDYFDATPESIGKIWQSRSGFKEVDLAAKGNAQVTLEPMKIE